MRSHRSVGAEATMIIRSCRRLCRNEYFWAIQIFIIAIATIIFFFSISVIPKEDQNIKKNNHKEYIKNYNHNDYVKKYNNHDYLRIIYNHNNYDKKKRIKRLSPFELKANYTYETFTQWN